MGVVTPGQAEAKIAEQKQEIQGEPKNLEEQAIALVGRDIYEKLVKGYMENLLEGIEVRLDTDYLAEKETYDAMAEQVIYTEYSSEWKPGDEPYYPVNDEKNNGLYEQYKQMADREEKVCFGGRLGEYKYYDMDAVILSALTRAREML